MGILTEFFNPAERQARKLEGLRTKRADAKAAFDAAVVAGDDATEAKAYATWQKLDGEIAAAEAAKAVAERHALHQTEAVAREDHARKVQELEAATQAYSAECIRFDELASGEVAAQWGVVNDAYRTVHEKSAALGSGHSVPHSLKPLAIWNRVMTRLVQTTGQSMPGALRRTTPIKSVSQAFKEPPDKAA